MVVHVTLEPGLFSHARKKKEATVELRRRNPQVLSHRM
jgi:hypothetical protein